MSIKPDGAVFFCFECEVGGTAFDFAALSVLGHRAQPFEIPSVLDACASRGLCTSVPGAQQPVRPYVKTCGTPVTAANPSVSKPLPNPEEVQALWNACTPAHLLAASHPARAYLSSRGLDVQRLGAAGNMVRVMRPADGPLPPWWFSSWVEKWPLVFPAYNGEGQLASLHARAVAAQEIPKTRWPAGRSLGGVLFADGPGLSFLQLCHQPSQLAGLETVVIAEGATDTLKMAQVLEGSNATWGVLGYVSGSKHALKKVRWPRWLNCLVAVDDDEAGDAYAHEIRRTLADVPVYRIRPFSPRTGGRKGTDWAEMDDASVRETLACVRRWEVLR